MPVVVPVLRVCTLFLNTYDSFKVLKVPPPSRRNNGLPSVRAMTQRKRDMKGVIAIWIVWCLIALYEKMVEHIVCIFIPFYTEIKSLILLFLLLTRARGAEPIYLHIVRPFLKPYTPAIDGILSFCGSLGDFLFALILSPFNISSSWWNRQPDDRREELEHDQQPQFDSMQTPDAFNYLQTPDSGFAVNSSIDLPATGPYPDPAEYAVPGMPIGAPRHQVWNPPPSAYETEDAPLTPEQQEEQRRQDEWRRYPQFPSAYPSTPYVPSKLSIQRDPPSYGSVEEHQNHHHHMPAPPATIDGQDFYRSLKTAREPQGPGSAFLDSLSDKHDNIGELGARQPLPLQPPVHTRTESSDSSGMDVDGNREDTEEEEMEEEEDSFNVTLRTPLHPSGSLRIRKASELATPMPSFLEAMEMDEGGSSESSDSVADRPVSAGTKRRRLDGSDSEGEGGAMSIDKPNTDEPGTSTSFAGNATLRPRPTSPTRAPSTDSAATYSDISDITDATTTTNTESRSRSREKKKSTTPEAKKRRVLSSSSSKIPTARRTRSSTINLKHAAGPTPARKARERTMKTLRSRSRPEAQSSVVRRGAERAKGLRKRVAEEE